MNIVKAVITKGSKQARTSPLWQYDYGQILQIVGLDLPDAYEVHFSNSENGDSTTSIGNSDGVVIPDAYLQSGENVYAWLYLHTGEDDGETVYHIQIPVRKRAAITDQQPTPVQQDVITQTIAALDAAVESVPGAIDEALATAKASGEFDGQDGFSPVVSVSEISGGHAVSVTDAEGTETFNVMDGQPGQDGEPGQDGYSPTATVTKSGKVATISITDKNGTTTATVSDGEDGTDIIDDTAGAGDTDKTFSADKLTTDHSAVMSALNNKISEPASDGTSGQVLTTDGQGGRSWTTVQGGGGTIDPQDIADAVDAWCDENITNPDSPPLDRSLSSSSAAAPADMVGDIENASKEIKYNVSKAPFIKNSTETGVDLDVTDVSGNVLIRLKNGHIQTKNFDSASIVESEGQSTPPVILSCSDGLNIVDGEYCDPQTGEIYDDSAFASFVRSAYLPVTPGDVVRATWCRHYIFFDEYKAYITGGDISSLTGYTGTQEENFITIPSGVAYLIVNYYVEYNTYAVTREGKGDSEIVVLGDSIYGIGPYPFNPVYYAAEKMKTNIADCAFGGSTASARSDLNHDKFTFHNIADCIASGDFTSMADFSGMPAIFKQHRTTLVNLDWTKVKVVCLSWCTNDWDFGNPLDNSQSRKSTSTFMGALRYGMEKIWTVYPQIQFVLFGALYKTVTNDTGHDTDSAVVNGKTLQDFIDGMKSVAEEYHMNFFDHYNIGFNSQNASVVFRPDGVHLSYDVGAKILGKRTANEIDYLVW